MYNILYIKDMMLNNNDTPGRIRTAVTGSKGQYD
jgi:hypothetical protein